ncbi:flavin reductase family protein [Polynucleobacter kasalickyi]|uniref:NADH-FMN oxidoreductase RutF, flavin reductase (DIM6/NTAB) family n=1 Tax=Polynucleobacter kasalickyi TaxID=1938817 RepID=A0A1W2A3N8_9BURK|nr:flavin reductase family protein [Polynucleobacter kasalickyi]SMC55246.1 NADH-FMN oxidoreductase RutF, flavin reductase (DIM6/NTAB) family [Polynucleobacter kasalickyi]
MQDSFYFYEPQKGHGLPHDPFKAIVGPRPIGWIGSKSIDGINNLAPYSFFNAVNSDPPMIGFTSTGYKDSVRNIEQTGEFTWNLVTKPLVEAMNMSCASVPPSVDEFELAQLTPAPSKLIHSPRVLASPVSFECKLSEIIQLKDPHQSPLESWFVIGHVVAVHILQSALKDGIYDTASMQHVMRGGGPADYFTVGPEQLFKLYRPK